MRRLWNILVFTFLISSVYSLTCYNGMKMLAMQSVGETTEECPSSAYCYNMSTSAMVMVNFVKAGCSTWRCMLAKDTCIFTTFQAIPVSLCCCSYDRCNVGGNPVYSDNPRQITGGGGGGGYNNNGGGNGGGSWGDASQNNNGWGNNNDQNNQQYNYGGQNAAPNSGSSAKPGSGAANNWGWKGSQKDMENSFKKGIDDRADEGQLEEHFKKVDANYKGSSTNKPNTLNAKKEAEQKPIGGSKPSNVGKDIEI